MSECAPTNETSRQKRKECASTNEKSRQRRRTNKTSLFFLHLSQHVLKIVKTGSVSGQQAKTTWSLLLLRTWVHEECFFYEILPIEVHCMKAFYIKPFEKRGSWTLLKILLPFWKSVQTAQCTYTQTKRVANCFMTKSNKQAFDSH